jgi:hypothetical protein
MDGKFWSIVTIAGPIILLAVIIWVVVRSRRRQPGEPPEQITERATEQVYKEEERARKAEEGDA